MSDIGKIGRKAVYDFIKSRFGRDHGERPKAFVADILTNYKFVYKHTERKVGASHTCCRMLNLMITKTSSGPFRCALITKVYLFHLQKISTQVNTYGHQTAALALATLAVSGSTNSSHVHEGIDLHIQIERGLILFMTGVNGGTAQRSDSIKFTNGSWGEKARQLVQVMKKLGDSEWNQIVEDRYLDHDVWPHQHQGVESDDDHQAEKLQRKRRA